MKSVFELIQITLWILFDAKRLKVNPIQSGWIRLQSEWIQTKFSIQTNPWSECFGLKTCFGFIQIKPKWIWLVFKWFALNEIQNVLRIGLRLLEKIPKPTYDLGNSWKFQKRFWNGLKQLWFAEIEFESENFARFVIKIRGSIRIYQWLRWFGFITLFGFIRIDVLDWTGINCFESDWFITNLHRTRLKMFAVLFGISLIRSD